ncbi:MAG: hypothetical protein JWN13_3498 [Betaproteobacteria bacterium]|jgi:hypothetical protein|nr:hypothetical protein [Betaproteobacteria bacterium]
MSRIRAFIYLLLVFCAYGFMGRMDYEDAVRIENAHKDEPSWPVISAPHASHPHLEIAENTPPASAASSRNSNACGPDDYPGEHHVERN